MKENTKRWLCLVLPVLMTAILMVFAFTCTDMYYENNDDAALIRASMGYEDGEPCDFLLFIHGLFAKPLAALSRAYEGVAWLSYLQMALLAVSCVFIVRAMLLMCLSKHQPLWVGALFGAIFIILFALPHIVRPTFTKTAGLLGAAAVAQLYVAPMNASKRQRIFGYVLSAVLLMLCTAMRDAAGLPALAYCLLVVFILLRERGKPFLKKALCLALALCMCVGVMFVTRTMEKKAYEDQDYLDLQEANSYILDYYGVENLSEEALETVGWTPAVQSLVYDWCFLDESVNADAFRTLTAYVQGKDTRSFTDRLKEAVKRMGEGLYNIQHKEALITVLFLIVVFVVMMIVDMDHPFSYFAISLAVLGCLVMMMYLGYKGRIMSRATMTVFLPMSVFFYLHYLKLMPSRRVINAVVCVLMVGLFAFSFSKSLPGMLRDNESELALGSAMGDLEEYALMDEESLFIYDETLLGADLRLFPEYPDGVPHNITGFGGWGMCSAANKRLFERFGIDIEHFDAETFLRDDVYFVRAAIDPPPQKLLNYLQEKLGVNVDWFVAGEYGSVYFLQFYEE